MCIKINEGQNVKVADHDINVYKVFRKQYTVDRLFPDVYTAPFRIEFIYEDLNKEYSCKDFGEKSIIFGGYKGFHSYKKKEDAIKTSIMLNDFSRICNDKTYVYNKCLHLLIPCVIPKGSKYYEVRDDNGEEVYMSNKIKLCLDNG